MRAFSFRRASIGYCAGFLWLAFIVAGFIVLQREASNPARPILAARHFPIASAIPLDRFLPTLILFAHPQCVCTRASLRELDRLRAQANDHLKVTVVFPVPSGAPVGAEKGVLWSEASRMPHVRVLRDNGGVESRRFGVTTSGHVLVYATSGKLLFSGGITASRGHEGDNIGSAAIVLLTRGLTPPVSQSPVFGCALL